MKITLSSLNKRSTQFNCKLVDLRMVFMHYEKAHNTANRESGILTTDRVHLNDKGNQLVADKMWEVLKNRFAFF